MDKVFFVFRHFPVVIISIETFQKNTRWHLVTVLISISLIMIGAECIHTCLLGMCASHVWRNDTLVLSMVSSLGAICLCLIKYVDTLQF